MPNRGFDHWTPFSQPAKVNYWVRFLLGENQHKATKKTDLIDRFFRFVTCGPDGIRNSDA